jgi:capsular polysaccharide transport system permease protein
MTMVGFVATGLIPFQIFRETVSRASNAVDANKSLLFYPQVRPLDLIIARCSLEGLTSTAVLAVILGFEGLVLGKLRVDDPLMVLLSLSMAVLLGGALGVVVGSLSVFSNTVSRIVPVLLRPLFWISGIFFTANTLPSHVRTFMLYNPVLHLVELTRGGYFADYDATYASPMYVCAWAITLLALGLMLERVARRRLELT